MIDFDANPVFDSPDESAGHQHRSLRLLQAAIAGPEQPIGKVEIPSINEFRQSLAQWNATERPIAAATLPSLFEAQAARSPQAPALVFEDVTLSYAELNLQANRLAHNLIRQGIGPETVVAIALPRSIEMVVSLLAVLKAGAAYLPLDPDQPPERLACMLHDAQPGCMLTIGPIAQLLPSQLAKGCCEMVFRWKAPAALG
jgi:non-ribosomal peptide synthetase component F